MKARLGSSVALLSFLLATGTAGASVSNDQVQSQHIREADGTSGQNTNSGAGVKTGHIQDSAVTSAKIQDGQVMNADLGPNAVTTDKLSAGAVTDAKISGTISAGKLPVGSTSGTVAAGDHAHDGLYQKKYANVVVVAKSGGDFTDPIAAINSITDASASNPYLMKIMPGIYDLGSSALSLKDYVDVEGSGENVTLIKSSIAGVAGGAVNVAGNSDIRFLAIANVGGGESAVGLSIRNFAGNNRLTNLLISASGGSDVNYGIINSGEGPTTMTNVVAIASGGGTSVGISNGQTTFVMNNVVATGTEGTSTNFGISNQHCSFEMSNVVATASGGQQTYGVYNYYAYTPSTMTNVTVRASEAWWNVGVLNGGIAPVMTNVFVTASGGTWSYGIMNSNESYPVMTNVHATATSGAIGYGMVNNGGGGSVLVDRCTLEGTNGSIMNGAGWTTRVGASKLIGGIAGLGSYACVGSYDAGYAALDAACQ